MAYKTSIADADESRREGMRDLGQAVRDRMLGGPSRDKLLAALEFIVEAKDLSKNPAVPLYALQYEFKERTNGVVRPVALRITKVKSGKKDDMIICKLEGGGAQAGVLRLKLERDSRENEFNHSSYSMTISFPDTDDFDDFAYLNEPTNDIRFSANPANPTPGEIDNAKLYLTAFKFLTRCK